MANLPEGARAYPRWDGPLSNGPLIGPVIANVLSRLFRSIWGQVTLLAIGVYTALQIGSISDAPDSVHTMKLFVDFLNNLRWGALAMAVVIGIPSLLEDQRRGALELYLGRAINTREYLVGKVIAVVILTTGAMFIPALAYAVATLFFFEKNPEGWEMAVPGALLYSLMLGLMITGLALGLGSISRSTRAATLLLLGGFVILDLVVSNLLEQITKDPNFQILSPFAAFQQQSEWVFKGIDSGAEFPQWWGLAVLIGLTVVGWALLAWRHPRVRGAE